MGLPAKYDPFGEMRRMQMEADAGYKDRVLTATLKKAGKKEEKKEVIVR